MAVSRRYGHEALEASRKLGRKDLTSRAATRLASAFLWESDLDRAEELALEARQLAKDTGAILSRGQALHLLAHVAQLRGDVDRSASLYREAIASFAEAGAALDQGSSLNHLAELVM